MRFLGAAEQNLDDLKRQNNVVPEVVLLLFGLLSCCCMAPSRILVERFFNALPWSCLPGVPACSALMCI